jgi:hypothetical protein
MKELPSSWAEEREDVLEVRGGTRRATKRRRIEWPSPRGEEKDPRDTAADLEAMRAEVLMRQAVAREVEYRPQEERRDSRPAHSAGGGACRHMERNDHGRLPSRCAPGRSRRPHHRGISETYATQTTSWLSQTRTPTDPLRFQYHTRAQRCVSRGSCDGRGAHRSVPFVAREASVQAETGRRAQRTDPLLRPSAARKPSVQARSR